MGQLIYHDEQRMLRLEADCNSSLKAQTILKRAMLPCNWQLVLALLPVEAKPREDIMLHLAQEVHQSEG